MPEITAEELVWNGTYAMVGPNTVGAAHASYQIRTRGEFFWYTFGENPVSGYCDTLAAAKAAVEKAVRP